MKQLLVHALLTGLAVAHSPVDESKKLNVDKEEVDLTSKPAVRKLETDGLNFALIGCKAAHSISPYRQFMPACVTHLRELVAEVDLSYTDVQLEGLLKHECWLKKKFPKSCDSGFDEEEHCQKFAMEVVAARDEELETGKTGGYKDCCQNYFVLRGGELPESELKAKDAHPPTFFDALTMPKVSGTLQCIINLAIQYFVLYTLLAIVRTLISFKFQLEGWKQILESGCTTVTYAPMLCVLFLGARMRAIQLSQGETEKYQLPQPWVQTSMAICSYAVLAQVLIVLLVGVVSGVGKVRTDSEGNLDLSSMNDANPVAVKILSVARYIVMAMLYGGFTAVVIGVFLMKGPKEIWGEEEPPVSPAVMCTILLSGMFFLVYLLVAIIKTCFELSRRLRSESQVLLKLETSATMAKMTVNLAPMLCILFIGARMRALQIDPKNGNPQKWAQNCFFMCTFSILIQALLVILLPFLARGECRRGSCEGDMAFTMENPRVGAVMTALRYICLLALYGGVAAVVYSVFTIQHPAGPSKTPPVSPAMQCVILLTLQFFLIYILLFVCATIKSFSSGAPINSTDAELAAQRFEGAESRLSRAMSKAITIFDAARSTVMFAPMLCILFIAARMRALQLAKNEDGTIPTTAGPQKWVQDAMYLATWSVMLQLIMSMISPLVVAETSERPKSGFYKYLAITVEVLNYIFLITMYIGATIVVVGVWTMTPEEVQPYSKKGLVPGFDVPNPPVPASAK